jgi:hypothetical protein
MNTEPSAEEKQSAIARTHAMIRLMLRAIGNLFVAPVRYTLILRFPTISGADLLYTNEDHLEDAIRTAMQLDVSVEEATPPCKLN